MHRPRVLIAILLFLSSTTANAQTNYTFLGPAFLSLLTAELQKFAEEPAGAESGPAVNISELIHGWSQDQQAAMGQSLQGQHGTALDWKAAVTLPLVQLAEDLLAVRPKLENIYFNYWNSTFQRYASYIEEARTKLGFSPTGPLVTELVQRFRSATGTTCTPAAFTPPAQQDAEISGTEVSLTLAWGSAQLTRSATQQRRDYISRIALPSATLAVKQPRYSGAYVAPAAFKTSVCRRQFTYGTAATTTIELWNPAVFAKDAAKSKFLLLSDADGDGIPNFLDKLDTLKQIREVIRSYQLDLATSLSERKTNIDIVYNKLIDSFTSVGLNVQNVFKPATERRQARAAARQEALRDLTQLFPGIQTWPLGTGVGKVFDKVLEEGLMSTLYRMGPRKGPFSMFNMQFQSTDPGPGNQAQSADQAGTSTDGEQTTAGGTADNSDGLGNLPSDIFKQLADELDKLLMQRSVAQELAANPPTAKKVVMRRRTDTTQQPAEPSNTAAMSSAAERLVQAVSEVFKQSAGDAPHTMQT